MNKKAWNYVCKSFIPAVAGFVIGVNVCTLLGVNPTYEASWAKVGFVALVALMFSFYEHD